MKKLIYTLILSLLTIFSSTAQWIQQTSGTTKGLYTIHFLNENTGWIAGEDGTILKTTNAGENWFSQSISTLDNIRSIFFTDSLNGWIALYEWTPFRHGSIYHTTNGGTSWFSQLTITDFALLSLFFTDDLHGWVAGTNGILFRTTNGGNNWQYLPYFTEGWLYSIRFVNSNIGWTAGDLFGQIAKTTNGGSSWFMQNIPIFYYLIDVYSLDQNFGWAVGSNGAIVGTTNGGSNWLTQSSGVTNELRDVHFTNENDGWIAGLGGVILHSTNGGAFWTQQNSNTTTDLYAISFVDELTGWVVGNNGTILKTNNGGVPVELSLFSYEIINNDVILSWSTATEINNQGFKVFRGENEIGYVPGSGTITEPREYSFKDENVKAGTYIYELIQIDFDGTSQNVGELTVEVINIPSDFMLEQNYPNPFNPSTNIKYSTTKDGFVTLSVYDLLGNEVERLVNDYQQAGHHNVSFNGTNLASGIYVYKLNVGEFTGVKKFILLK